MDRGTKFQTVRRVYIFNEGKEKGTYGEYKDYTSVYLKARYAF